LYIDLPEEVTPGQVLDIDPPLEYLEPDAYGNKRKVKVRLVDPDTQMPLADDIDLDPEEVTAEGKLRMRLPLLPAKTKALFQVSLDDGDTWDSFPQPGWAYSFVFVDLPHIVKLYPAFGHVKDKNDAYMLIEGTEFKCPDKACDKITVRFGEIDQAIYVKG
jgi:hypothetical protein